MRAGIEHTALLIEQAVNVLIEQVHGDHSGPWEGCQQPACREVRACLEGWVQNLAYAAQLKAEAKRWIAAAIGSCEPASESFSGSYRRKPCGKVGSMVDLYVRMNGIKN
jgi:hypothetical protein